MATVLTMQMLENPTASYYHLYFTRYCCTIDCPEMPLFYFSGLLYQQAPTRQKLTALYRFAVNGVAGGAGQLGLAAPNLAGDALDDAQTAVNNPNQQLTGHEFDEALNGEYGVYAEVAGLLGAYNNANAGGRFEGANIPLDLAQIIARYRTALQTLTNTFTQAGFNTQNIGIPGAIQ